MKLWEVDSPLGLWRYFWEKIADQWNELWAMISNLQPAQPSNKPQKFIRSALALFSNLSSLFVCVVLLIAVSKIGILWIVRNDVATDLLGGLGPHFDKLLLLFILLFFVSVKVLLRISNFIKSYRIMTLIGIVSVVSFLARGSFVVLSANSLSDLRHTSWQFLLSALK